MKIGRCTDIKLEAFSPSDSTVGITVTSKVDAFTSRVVLQQLQGLSGATVPVIGDDCDPIDDGFYRVVSVSGNVAPAEWHRRNEVRVGLTLAPASTGAGATTIETYITAVERPTDHTLGTIDQRGVWPAPNAVWANQNLGTVTVYGGDDAYGYAELANDADYDADFVLRSGVIPADFYGGAATIEAWYPNASAWSVVEGRSLPPAQALRLSNGVIRVGFSDSDLTIQRVVADGSAWGDVFSFELSDSTATTMFFKDEGFVVSRNEWTTVSIKVPTTIAAGAYSAAGGSGVLTVRLDALADHCELFFDPLGDSSGVPNLVHPSGGQTQISATYGRSSYGPADSNDHRWVGVTPASGTPTDPQLEVDARGVGVGVTLDDTTGAITNIAKDYFLAQSIEQIVVAL